MLAQVLLSAARVAGGGLAVAGLVGDFLLLEWMFECLAEVVWLAVAGLVGDFLLVEWMCGVDVRVSC